MFHLSYFNRGTKREIWEKGPENNNIAWITLSEASLSILKDCWEKFICSSLPARLMEEFPDRKLTYWQVSQQTYVQTLQASLGENSNRPWFCCMLLAYKAVKVFVIFTHFISVLLYILIYFVFPRFRKPMEGGISIILFRFSIITISLRVLH